MEQKQHCSNCEQKTACVPFFLHENAMMHYNRANKRMLVALITVCVTLAVIIGIFVRGNTIREKQLIDMAIQQRITEVDNAETAPPP